MPTLCVNRREEETWIVQNSKSCKRNLEVFELATSVGGHISHLLSLFLVTMFVFFFACVKKIEV